ATVPRQSGGRRCGGGRAADRQPRLRADRPRRAVFQVRGRSAGVDADRTLTGSLINISSFFKVCLLSFPFPGRCARRGRRPVMQSSEPGPGSGGGKAASEPGRVSAGRVAGLAGLGALILAGVLAWIGQRWLREAPPDEPASPIIDLVPVPPDPRVVYKGPF